MASPLNRNFRAAVSAVLAVAFTGSATNAAAAISEHQVKAAFIYNFIRFVDWPTAEPGKPIRVAVAADEEIFESVRDALHGKTIGDRLISVAASRGPADAADADVVYITGNDEETIRRYMSVAEGRPVLTITETKRFPNVGSLVNFYLSEDSVRFAVNATALERSALKMSSQMLQYASIVRGTP